MGTISSPCRSSWATPASRPRRSTPKPPPRASAEAAAYVRRRAHTEPTIGLILGTGLGGLAERIADAQTIPYAGIPHFPCSAVEGHANELVLGRLAGRDVVALRGRVHLYEGCSAAEVAFPTRVLHALGVRTLIVSNAAGGLNLDFRAGDLMLIRDHIFLPGLAGHNPLKGPNDPELGARFPSMVDAYEPSLRALAKSIAAEQGVSVREGVYVMVAGPSYETSAECQTLRAMGADAVGMSTCPEVVVARHMGMRVLGISLITNVLDGTPVSHEDVLATAGQAAERFCALLQRVVAGLKDA